MNGDIVDLCLNTLSSERMHKLGTGEINLIKIKEEDIEMEISIAVLSFEGYLDRFSVAKSLIISINDLPAALTKFLNFL